MFAIVTIASTMNPTTRPRPESRLVRLERFFREHPNQWVSALQLAEVGGYLSVRGRVSDLRRQGMNIQNKTTTIDGVVVSTYMFVTKVEKPGKVGQEPLAAALPL